MTGPASSFARLALLGLALGAPGACARSPTQIVLVVDTDMTQGPSATLTHVRIVVKSPANTVVWQRLTYALRRPADGGATFELPGTLGIVAGDDGARTIEVDVDAVHDPGGEGTVRAPMFTYYAVAAFEEGETRTVRVFLADRCRAAAVACTPTETCALERCVPREVLALFDASTGVPSDAAAPDAPAVVSPDAPPAAQPDAPPAAQPDAPPADVPRPDAPPAAQPDVTPVDVPRPDPGCPAGRARCGTACITTATDVAHCGACGRVCPAGQTCAGGACACAAPSAVCGGACVNPQTDPRNCGACGRACGAGAVCTAGRCACPSGSTEEASVCVSLASDPNNCGARDARCRDDQMCAAGACVCRAGLTATPAGDCVDLRSSPMNCGSLNTRCGGATPVCVAGVCRASSACAAPDSACSNACVNRLTHPQHCGDCGHDCHRDEVCVSGNCRRYLALVGCNRCPCACPENSTCCASPGGTAGVCVESPTCS